MLKYRDSSEQNFFFLIKIQSLVYIYIHESVVVFFCLEVKTK